MKMCAILILAGYVLVSLKLFEMISIIFLFILIALRKYFSIRKISNFYEFTDAIKILMFDILDGVSHPIRIIKHNFKVKRKELKTYFNDHPTKLVSSANFILLFLVIIYSAWMRFQDALLHAAPGLSDSYTTLAWMKHIDSRILFYEPGGGVYPRGFHIILDVINKFAVMDWLYTLRYTGPFVAVLTILGIYFAVSRLTKRTLPGVIAAMIYGLLGTYLPINLDLTRQASTNSQEFGFIFILPVLYFFYEYIKSSDKGYFYAASAGLLVTSLVHQLAFAYTSVGVAILVFVAFITNIKAYWKSIYKIILSGIVCAVATFIPFAIGFITNFKAHAASLNFLTEKAINKIPFPTLEILTLRDRILLSILALTFLYFVIARIFGKPAKELMMEKFIFLLGVFSFCYFFFGGALTQNVMISSRSQDFWSLVLPCCVAVGWNVITKFIPVLSKKPLFEIILCFGLLAYILIVIKPLPFSPYKMHRDANVEQYLSISSQFRPKTWWIVSSQYEDYSIVSTSGYLVFASKFITDYSPYGTPLTLTSTNRVAGGLPLDVFIFYDKNIFKVKENNYAVYALQKPEYERREKEKIEISKWVLEYKKTHTNISVFYSDKNLEIYHITIPKDKKAIFDSIWKGGQ